MDFLKSNMSEIPHPLKIPPKFRLNINHLKRVTLRPMGCQPDTESLEVCDGVQSQITFE